MKIDGSATRPVTTIWAPCAQRLDDRLGAEIGLGRDQRRRERRGRLRRSPGCGRSSSSTRSVIRLPVTAATLTPRDAELAQPVRRCAAAAPSGLIQPWLRDDPRAARACSRAAPRACGRRDRCRSRGRRDRAARAPARPRRWPRPWSRSRGSRGRPARRCSARRLDAVAPPGRARADAQAVQAHPTPPSLFCRTE